MSSKELHGKELLHVFHYMQKGFPLFEINYRVQHDCTKDVEILRESNEKVRREVLSVNSFDYHEVALNDTAFNRLLALTVNDWSHFEVALAYMHTCAAVDDKCVTFYADMHMDSESTLGRIARYVTQDDKADTLYTPLPDFHNHFDEYEFIQTLNDRNVDDNEYAVLLASVLNEQADGKLLKSYVSDRALSRVCKMLTGLKEYNELTVATVYILSLLIIANPEEEPRQLYDKYMNGAEYPPYLERFGWNPRNVALKYTSKGV